METLDHMGELLMGSFLLMRTLHLNELNALEIIFDCRMSMFSATILLISFLQMTVLLKREMTNSCFNPRQLTSNMNCLDISVGVL